MCGLFGMVGPGIKEPDIGFLRDLAYVSGLRGHDGTGVVQGFLYKKQFKFSVTKTMQEVSYFMWYHLHGGGKKNVLNNTVDNFFAGHTRGATLGDITDENAHPFHLENIVGMHNGTLKDERYFDPKRTDSEMLFRDIDKNGIGVLSTLKADSAFAVVILDKKKRKFLIARNEHRPLYWAVNKDRNVLYWASELRMLSFCGSRNGIKFSDTGLFEAGMVYEFAPKDAIAGIEPLWETYRISSLVVKDSENAEGVRRVLGMPTSEMGLNIRSANNQNFIMPQKDEPLLFPKDTPKKKSFIKRCHLCNKKMDLYEQYKGTEFEVGKFWCDVCDELQFQAQEIKDDKDKSGEVTVH